MQSEPLAAGTAIAGKYIVERVLGRGGMGVVYAVSHATTGKRMAMKCLLPEFLHDAGLVARFMREAQAMGRLAHRHVVDVFDVGRDGDILFIVMELLQGKPLSELLHDASLTLEEALVIVLRAMEGVAAAHDQGVIHRDLKPDNIFVCLGASGRLDDPRVLDFGISKLDDEATHGLTRSGVAMGTPYYMALEQLNGQRDLDQRVDVYAMGVILYEALSGELPFKADSLSALAIRMLTTEPAHLATLSIDLPSGLAGVVMKAMARQRDARYRSMRQLIEALRPFVPHGAGLLVPEGKGRPLRTPRANAHAVGPHARTPVAEASRPSRQAAPPAPRPGWGRPLALGGALLAVAIAGSLWIRGGATHTHAAGVMTLSPPLSSANSKVESPRSATLTADAGVSMSQVTHDAGAAVASPPADAGRPRVWARPGVGVKPRMWAPARPQLPAPQPSVAPQTAPEAAQPSPPRKTAEGRAGRLGSEEF